MSTFYHGQITSHSPVAAEDTKPTNPKDLVGVKKLPMPSVVPPVAFAYLGWAMRDGARKYGPFNWREKGVRASVYTDAAMRHILAWWDGEEDAPDSKVHHLAHAMACLGILADAKHCDQLVDDRPKPGGFADLVEELREK